MPLGIGVLDWTSARLLSHIAHVLLREILGVNTTFKGPFASTVAGTYALAGCQDPSVIGGPLDRGCSRTHTRSDTHVSFETWETQTTPLFWEALSEVIGRSKLPIDLASVGYDGFEGLYVPPKPRLAALESAGLPLEYYRSYNSSWHNTGTYFDKYSDISTDGLLRCSDSRFAYESLTLKYLEMSNDTEGVEVVNGRLVSKCHGGIDGYWWFAPACRDDPETCIPVIDGGDGWFTDVFMQQAAAFNMPLALAVGNWSKYCSEPTQRDMMFYWWSPDTAFINLRPTRVVFPPWDQAAWAAGVKTSERGKVALTTRVHYAIPDEAPRVSDLLAHIQLTLAQSQALLIETTANASKPEAEIACDWLKANQDIWSSWVPYETKCPKGWGLMSSTGVFVTDRALASQCNWCPPGTYSNKITDSTGPTAVCLPCDKGKFQPNPGQSSCVSCEPGTFTGKEGQSVCEDCPIGTYAEGVGSVNCTTCGGGARLWTTMRKLMVRGAEQWVSTTAAASKEACGCDVGARFDDTGACVECSGEGLECVGMGEVVVSPGFYSPSELSVYKCVPALNCKGGVPGDTCFEGREGIACQSCKPGFWEADEGLCVPCTAGDKLPFALLVTFLILLCFIAYWLIDRGARGESAHAMLLLGISGGLVVALMQQLSVLSLLDVRYDEPLRSFLQVVHVFTFQVEKLIRIACIRHMSSAANFTSKVCSIFSTCFVVVIVHIGFVIVKYQRRFRERTPSLVAAFGTLAMIFYISVTVTILQPFQCDQNPNGRWTTRSYKDVICWEEQSGDEHKIMLGVSLCAILMPILLFAKVFHLVRQLPHALKAGDTIFMRSYGFLFCRFRPQAHWYIMIIMSRSLFIAMVPILPWDIAKIYALQVALIACFSICIYYQPWRVPSLNFMDAFFGAMMTLFMQMTSFCVKLTNLEVLGWVSVSMVITALVFLVTLTVQALLRRYGKLAKNFSFFLCHVKSESGAFARWLKLELVSKPQVKQDVFLDADNLESLSSLLDCVASGVSTLVVIASRSVFHRPWCVGEMTTAHANSVHCSVLQMPDFEELTLEAIERYETLVPDLESLCVDNGISLDEVREALTEFSRRERICVSTTISGPGMAALGTLLIAGTSSVSIIATSTKAPSVQSEVGIVRDGTVEANATAFVLARCMVRYMCFAAMGSPEVLCLDDSEDMPRLAKAILLCTNGCFAEIVYLNRVCELSDGGIPMLPVIGDDDFKVPRQETFLTIHAAQLRPAAEGGIRGTEMVARMVAAIFTEIAMPFRAKSERYVVLETAAASVAKRLTEPRYKRDGSIYRHAFRTGSEQGVSDDSESTVFNKPDDAEALTLESCEAIGDKPGLDIERRKRFVVNTLAEYLDGCERSTV